MQAKFSIYKKAERHSMYEAVMARVAVMGAAAVGFLIMHLTGNHMCAAFIYGLTVATFGNPAF